MRRSTATGRIACPLTDLGESSVPVDSCTFGVDSSSSVSDNDRFDSFSDLRI
jgi:hypothetical protein